MTRALSRTSQARQPRLAVPTQRATAHEIKSLQQWAKSKPSKRYAMGAEGALVSPLRQIPWIYAAIRKLWSAVGVAPLKFRVDQDPESNDLAPTDPLVQLFERPSPTMSRKEYLTQVVQFTQTTGEAFHVFHDAEGRVIRPQDDGLDAPIPMPAQITVRQGGGRLGLQYERGLPKSWRFSDEEGSHEIPYAAGLNVRMPSEEDRYRGLAPLAPVLGIGEAMFLAELMNRKQASRGGLSGLAMVNKTRTRDDVYETMQEMADRVQDSLADGRIPYIEGEIDFKKLVDSHREMAYSRLSELGRKDISAVFGVPDAVLGMGSSNYATFAGEMRGMWETTVRDLQCMIEDAINWHLIPRLRVGSREVQAWAYFDNSKVAWLQPDYEELGRQARGLMAVGVPRRAALDRVGLVEVENTEFDEIPMLEGGLESFAEAVRGSGDESAPGLSPEQAAELRAILLDVGKGALSPEAAVLLIASALPIEEADARKMVEAIEVKEPQPVPPALQNQPPPVPPGAQAAPEPEVEVPDEPERERALYPFEIHLSPRLETRTRMVSQTPQAERDAIYDDLEARREEGDSKISRAVRQVWREAKERQLEHLRAFAAGGGSRLPRRSLYGEDRGIRLLGSELRDLAKAIRADREQGEQLVPILDCCGQEIAAWWAPVEERQRNWFAEHGNLASLPGGLRRLADVAVLREADPNLSEAEIEALLVLGSPEWAKEIAEALEPVFLDVLGDSVRRANSDLSIPYLAEPDAVLLRLARKNRIKLARDIQGTLATRVRSAMVRTLSEGPATVTGIRERVRETLAELEETVEDQFGKANDRALTIARTETAYLDNAAEFRTSELGRDAGEFLTHEWLAASRNSPPTGRTRPTHVEVDRTVEFIGQAFRVGKHLLLHPGDKQVDAPEETINCRCALRRRRLQTDLDEGLIDQATFDRLQNGAA